MSVATRIGGCCALNWASTCCRADLALVAVNGRGPEAGCVSRLCTSLSAPCLVRVKTSVRLALSSRR